MFFLLQSSLWQKIEHWDQSLFLLINTDGANSFFDAIMPFARNALNWAPLYLFLVVFALMNFKHKGGWWCLFLIATVALTDMTGTYVFKHPFHRLRPCNDPSFFFHVRLLVPRSSGYSFISNHAANHFAMATFFYISMAPVLKKWALLAFIWAAWISYAQVYVGVHYPLDVLCGALLGLMFGAFTGRLFNKRFGFVIFDNQPTLSS